MLLLIFQLYWCDANRILSILLFLLHSSSHNLNPANFNFPNPDKH
uniref:Uncharacterized protein n=1 Tax=Rhizophora mucronata TaxID=61149 RepID=A0A2P2NH75_RHIMU